MFGTSRAWVENGRMPLTMVRTDRILLRPWTRDDVGFCGFRFIDEGPEIELVYGLQAEHWGKGLATEACMAALDYLWRFTDYRQVYARTDPPNDKSVRVMLRLGMTHESTTCS